MTPQHIAPTPEQTPAERLREVVRGIMAAIEPLYAATIDLVTELVHERFPTASTLSVYGEYNEESNLRVRVASIRVLREDDDAYTIDVEEDELVLDIEELVSKIEDLLNYLSDLSGEDFLGNHEIDLTRGNGS